MSYKISVKALEDIESIWIYTFENWSLEQADTGRGKPSTLNLTIDKIVKIVSW
jgi:toxin ParE1/3/4